MLFHKFSPYDAAVVVTENLSEKEITTKRNSNEGVSLFLNFIYDHAY
jgi:hypothetical protein